MNVLLFNSDERARGVARMPSRDPGRRYGTVVGPLSPGAELVSRVEVGVGGADEASVGVRVGLDGRKVHGGVR